MALNFQQAEGFELLIKMCKNKLLGLLTIFVPLLSFSYNLLHDAV